MKVLVFAEQRAGKLKSSALEALTVGAKLAGSTGDLAVVLVGKGTGAMAAQVAGYGADTAFVFDDGSLEHYNVMTYAACVAEAIKSTGMAPNRKRLAGTAVVAH